MAEMGDANLFSLKWNNFSKIVSTQYELLRDAKSLTDVTFICDGSPKRIEAHKLVLYACSPYFKGLIEEDLNTKHLVLFFSDVKYDIMKALLEYMYLGEVNIRNEDLKEFIRVAEKLKVRGLDSSTDEEDSMEQLAKSAEQKNSMEMAEKKRQMANLEGNPMKRVCSEDAAIMTDHEMTSSNVVSMDGETTTDKICTLLASKTITGHEIQSIEVDYSHQNQGLQMANEFKTEDAWMDDQMQSPMPQSQHNQQNDDKSPKSGKISAHNKRLSQCMTPTACQLCSRVYSNVSNLRQHMRLIHNPAPVICPVCKKHFSSNLYLKRHYSSIHGGGTGNSSGDEGLSKPDNAPTSHSDWHIYDTTKQ
ncbi:protein tramtrack, alpha isoform-like [Culicoides brevitarsis]|uniref:protein tramtrack, alpha isoform-like n=1 Tax=Culicoides brevitarsis TaxID=469753 RepID=UPI00307C884C